MGSGSIKIKSSWDEVTVGDIVFMREVEGLQVATEDERNMMVAARLAGMEYGDFLQLPLGEVSSLMDRLDFIYGRPEPVKARRSYVVNGRRYDLIRDRSEMTLAQYVDFQAIQAEGFSKRPAELLAIFLVPEGHQYNDGYDREVQAADMLDLGVREALGICDFFTRRFVKSINLITTALRLRMRLRRLTARRADRERMRALEIQMGLLLDSLGDICGLTLSGRSPSTRGTTGRRYSG